MKKVLSVLGICLLITLMSASTAMAMGKAKKAECTKCPEGKCVCEAAKEAGKCCGTDPSKCCAKKVEHPKAEHPK
jgi:hypothetical protein